MRGFHLQIDCNNISLSFEIQIEFLIRFCIQNLRIFSNCLNLRILGEFSIEFLLSTGCIFDSLNMIPYRLLIRTHQFTNLMINLNLINPKKLHDLFDRLKVNLNLGNNRIIRPTIHLLRIANRRDSVDISDPFLELILLKLIPQSLGLFFSQVILQRKCHN